MLSKLPLRWALRLGLWLVVGGLVFGVWANKSALAARHVQIGDNTGRIAGFVTNAEGMPLEGIEVSAYRYDPQAVTDVHWPYPWWHTNDAISDAAGAYQIANLQPGVYTLHFFDPTEFYAFEYLNDSLTLTDAMTIEVRTAQMTSGINVTLAPGGVIQGQISMYDGTPVSQIEPRFAGGIGGDSRGSITLLVQDGEWQNVVKRIDFDSWDSHFDLTTSTFNFRGLPSGNYRLSYGVIYGGVAYTGGNSYYEFYPNTANIDQARNVPITPADMQQNLTIVVGANPTYGRIQGRVTDSAGEPVAGVAILAFSTNAPVFDTGYDGYTATPDRSTLTDAAGYYEIPALAPDDYRLHFFDPASTHYPQLAEPPWATNLHMPEYYSNKLRWSTADVVHVITGSTTSTIDAMLEIGTYLSGQVRMVDGSLLNSDDTSSRTTTPWFSIKHQRFLEQGYPLYPYQPKVSYDRITGSYLVGGLAPGTYVLEYGLAYDYNGVNYANWRSIPITIQVSGNAPLIQDIVVPESAKQQEPSPSIRGRVTDETGMPLVGIKVSAAVNCNDGRDCTEPRDITDEQGNFDLYLQPNIGMNHSLSFSDPSGVYAFEYYDDSPTVSGAKPIQVAEDGTVRSEETIISDIHIKMSPASKLTGHITLFDGTPLAAMTGEHQADGTLHRGSITLSSLSQSNDSWQLVTTIDVFSSTVAYWGNVGSRLVQFDMATNTYHFAGLTPGRYQIAVEAVHNGIDYGGASPDRVEVGSTYEITVAAGVSYNNVDLILGTDNQRVLALYALALDHDHDRIDNLAPQLAPAMQSIIDATRHHPNKTAVVLADAAGVGDTRIYVVRNGRATPVQGLPNAAFQLDPTATEANMADGVTLGNFIRWARNSYPAEVTLFGFVGHGAPLVPATGFETLVAASGGIRPRILDSLFPLPTRVGAYPSLTDNHPQALITPYDLATALRIGSNNGTDPLQIADVAHCFAASIEELYELSPNGDQPYAEIILASPTYTYLDPPALGQALGAINTLMTPARMADQILQTYDALIDQADQSDGDADVEHPRLLVAVNSRQVARVKQDWDKVAYHLLQNFDEAKIRQAYQASPHYDTTVCRPQDWSLGPPDALADLYGFAAALITVYGADSAVGGAATVVLRDLEDTAILSRYQRNGIPWYAPKGAPLWNFDNHKGIALFADLQGRPTDQPGTVELSWQTRWYTADPLNGENPHPYAFVQNGFNGVTWATLFAEFWRRQPGVTIQTALCFPELATEPQTGELRIVALNEPLTGTVRVGLPFTPTAVVQTDHAALKPTVRFNLYDANQALLLSNTVQGGYWLTGTHQLTAMRPYTPTAPGDLTIEVIVDPTNNVSEANEADNRLVQRYTVAPPDRFPLVISARLAEPTFFVNQKQVALHALVSPADSATTLVAQLYQFTNDAPSAPWQPMPQARQTLDPAKPTLVLTDLAPGVVVAHIWARTAQGLYSARPAVVLFNYAPANQMLGAGQTHLYWLATPLATALQLDLTGSADLFAWSPFNGWGPEWRMGGAPLILPASTLTDGYLLAVTTVADSQYTLTAQPTANPTTVANATPDLSQSWPVARLHLVQPVINPPGGGALVAGRHSFLPLVTR